MKFLIISQRSILHALILSGVAAAFSSCSIVRNSVTPERAAALKPGEGLAVATFAYKSFDRSGQLAPGCTRVTIRAKGLGANNSVQAFITPEIFKKEQSELMPLAGFGGTERSDVVAVPLPEGEYEITGWTIMATAVTAEVIFSNRLPMKVPFSV
jgi:hypothetical protein